MREVAARSREIQDYYSAVTMKSSGDISADLNYRPRAKSGPRSRFIRPAKTFCQK